MVRIFVLTSALAATAFLAPGQEPPPISVTQEPPPGILLFAHARTKMQSHLKGQPNYVCLETVERSQRDPRKKRSGILDVLRLEVAIIGRKELYAWPGSNRFEEKDLVDMVPAGGTIGSGAFAIHAWNLFNSGGPSIRAAAAEWTEVDQKRLARFPYDVGQLSSGLHLGSGRGNWAVVAYHGSIWIDPESEEVTRIEMIATEIPLQLGLEETHTVIDFGEIEIGGQKYRLPVRTMEMATTFGGQENRNEGRFTSCRQFVGESKLTFDDAPAAVEQRSLTDVILPEGVTFRLELVTPIDSGQSKTGDPIDAVLASAIKQKKQVLFERGSRVEGRLVRLQNTTDGTIEAELQFVSISDASHRAVFTATAQVETPRRQAAMAEYPEVSDMPNRLTYTSLVGRPGWLRISTEGRGLAVPKGSRTNWITTAAGAPREVR